MYLIAGCAWAVLLWPMPNTVLLAGCFAILSYPLYLALRRHARRGRRRLECRKHAAEAEYRKKQLTGKAPIFVRKKHTLPWFQRVFFGTRLSWLNSLPMLGTFSAILFSIAVPVCLFVLMVAPQISSGFARLRELWMHNFQLPEEVTERLNNLLAKIQTLPGMDKLVSNVESYQNALADYLSNFSTDTVVKWANQGFDLLGGASSVAMHFAFFLCLSVIFISYATRIRLISARLLHVNPLILHRFTLVIRSALRAVLLGVILVAAIQGILCAIGFALVDIRQFAFWGLLAAILAPIPMFGTALVWAPLALHLWVSERPAAALGLILYCLVIVSTADSVLRPMFLKTGIKAPFLVLILVIFCGIAVFGTIGIILGPIMLAVSIQALEEGNMAYPSILTSMAVKSGSSASPDGRAHD